MPTKGIEQLRSHLTQHYETFKQDVDSFNKYLLRSSLLPGTYCAVALSLSFIYLFTYFTYVASQLFIWNKKAEQIHSSNGLWVQVLS